MSLLRRGSQGVVGTEVSLQLVSLHTTDNLEVVDTRGHPLESLVEDVDSQVVVGVDFLLDQDIRLRHEGEDGLEDRLQRNHRVNLGHADTLRTLGYLDDDRERAADGIHLVLQLVHGRVGHDGGLRRGDAGGLQFLICDELVLAVVNRLQGVQHEESVILEFGQEVPGLDVLQDGPSRDYDGVLRFEGEGLLGLAVLHHIVFIIRTL